MPGKCCSKGPKSKKPGLCRCWHKYGFCLFPILIFALGLLALEIYAVAKHFIGDDHTTSITIILIVALVTSLFLVVFVQIVYLLIYYEATNWKSILLLCIFFGITICLGLATFALTLTCDCYCPFTDRVVDIRAYKENVRNCTISDSSDSTTKSPDSTTASSKSTTSASFTSYTQLIRWISILKLILILVAMRLYIYYCYQFRQELSDRKDPECAKARAQSLRRRSKGKDNRVHPQDRRKSRARRGEPRVNVFYVTI